MEIGEVLNEPHRDKGSYADTEWSRIHGWLFFFCFQCGISIPWLLIESARKHDIKVTLINILLVTTNALMIALVVMRSQFVFAGVVVQLVERIIVQCDNLRIGLQLIHMNPVQHERGVLLLSRLAFGLPMIVAWLIYFRRSKRVRAVFGGNL